MKIFGLSVPFTGSKALSPVPSGTGGWWPLIRESFSGAWQQNVIVDATSVLANHAVFACQTLIASDIAKLRVKLVQRDSDGIWTEVTNPAYSPVLRKPNAHQNRIQFVEAWVLSKLRNGNAYILKQRDSRGVVSRLYVLDPFLVTPLVADDGSVFYELRTDYLAGLGEAVRVPAREIIHDRFNCLFHPLVGLSPIFANGLAATNGLAIQNNATTFFQNGSTPGGVLTAPGHIADETAARLKASWQEKFSGANIGKVAVLGDGLKYEHMAVKATDAQLIEQLKWSAEVVCTTYHVPPYKIGIGAMPSYNNIQALNLEYYSQCLQIHIEAMELALDEGLDIREGVGTEFDTDNLLRMDTVTQLDALEKAKSLLTLDERRARFGEPKLPVGGSTVYLQQQDHSIEAIAARDKLLIEQSSRPPTPEPAEEPVADPADEENAANDNAESEARAALVEIYKGLR